MSERDDLLSQFTGITGLDAERAKFFLDSSNWQLDVSYKIIIKHITI